jgi:hypothetical protein
MLPRKEKGRHSVDLIVIFLPACRSLVSADRLLFVTVAIG